MSVVTRLLGSTDTDGDAVLLAPGGYEFQASGVGSDEVTLEFKLPDGTWAEATYPDGTSVSLSSDGAVPVTIPAGSEGVRAVVGSAGPQAWLVADARGIG